MDDAAVSDPAIAALRQRVHVTEDPAMSAVAPRLRPARVTVTLKDGRTGDAMRAKATGAISTSRSTDSELRDKFRELAGFVLDARRRRAVEEQRGAVRGVDERAGAERADRLRALKSSARSDRRWNPPRRYGGLRYAQSQEGEVTEVKPRFPFVREP